MSLKLLILAIFLITSKLIANESLQTNFTNLKKLLDSKTISIEQFNNGIDNLSISSEDYKSLRELFKNNIINQKDYLNILENLIFESLDMVEKKVIDTDEQSFKDLKEIDLSLIIFQVGHRVPLSIDANVGSIEKLSLLINENKVEKILIKDNSNTFFSYENVRFFKDIKINLNNQKTLKGKSRLSINSFADANLVMWWDIDLFSENPKGEIVIEIPGKGPQIKLRPN